MELGDCHVQVEFPVRGGDVSTLEKEGRNLQDADGGDPGHRPGTKPLVPVALE